MGTYCAPLVADLFLFCYQRDFMMSLSDVKQTEIIEAFKSTSRYLDDILNIDTGAPFLDLHISISNGFVSSKIYDKRDDFDCDIVNFLFF